MIWDRSPADLFRSGGPLMWPLLACSVLVAAIILDRVWTFWRVRLDFRRFVAELGGLVTRGALEEAHARCRRSRNPIAAAAGVYLEHRDADDVLRAARIQREGALALERVENRIRWLLTGAHLATLLGLLGTVTGLAAAFYRIEAQGGHVQPADLAGGIWEALLTTIFGLTVAIPAMFAHHLFDERADRMARQMSFIVSYLDEWTGKRTQGIEAAAGGPRAAADPLSGED